MFINALTFITNKLALIKPLTMWNLIILNNFIGHSKIFIIGYK